MHYIIQFDIAAMIITGVFLIMYILLRGYSTVSGKLFISMVATTFFSAGLDLLSVYSLQTSLDIPVFLEYLLNGLYLLATNACVLLFYLYVLSIVREGKTAAWKQLIWKIVAFLEVGMMLASPWTHWIFYIDEAGQYRHGPLFITLYFLSFGLMLLAAAQIIWYRKRINRTQAISILAYCFAIMGAVILQYFKPEWLLTQFSLAVVLIVLYTCLEKPSDFMYKNSYCYNNVAFDDYLEKHLGRNNFNVVIAGPENADYLRKQLSENALAQLMDGLIQKMHETFGQKNVFYIHRCHFAVITTGDPKSTVIEPFQKSFPEDMVFKDITVSLSYCFRILSIPESISTMTEARTAIDFSLRREYEGDKILNVTRNELKKVTREVDVLNSIRRALKNHSFNVYYQPIYDNSDGQFHSAEALLRLQDPELGFVPPDEFIPIAERNGLIPEVGAFVLESVCQFWQDRHPDQYGIRFIEVNLSPMQCMQNDLPEWVFSVLKQYEVPVSCINLEITETASINNQDTMDRNMREMVKRGIAFSLDDYGTGYSNVDHLAGLPLEIVKVDKSIVWKAVKNPDSNMILRHSIRMIHDLGLKAVAEGVENEEMISMLREMGCNYFQGYYYSRPIPEEDFLAFLAKKN